MNGLDWWKGELFRETRWRRAGKDSCFVWGFENLGKMGDEFSGVDFQERKETFTKSKLFVSEELYYLCSVSSQEEMSCDSIVTEYANRWQKI